MPGVVSEGGSAAFFSAGDAAGAGGDGQGFGGGALVDDVDEVVKGDGGADVPWDACEGGADGEVRGERGFEDEVFLVVHDGDGVWEGWEDDARVGHFGGDGFVAEVEAEEVGGGFADDAAEEDGGVEEVEIGELAAVAGVPEDAGAGA